ncbi:LacI family DNA-binding transcriptional regulator [Pseudarthrobacter equi]|uniref:LacI family DNA-binding transcriptional regulator n=1 Tax=Pseudarthrobacter equi TaxID=728066 RepID=UPI0028D6EF9F|nr:LacI family DNA-binding transcriptional regulator [Pseudarthrobacter equi]
MPTDAPTRRVTTYDIAKSLGISRATVGFVLNNTAGQTISEATRTKVLQEAKRLGYRRHSAARTLASGRSNIVLLVLPDWPLDFSLRRNIEEASLTLDQAGYTLVTYTPHPSGQARPLWETIQPDLVLALTSFTPGQAEAIKAAGVPRLLPGPDSDNTEAYSDNGPVLQLEHLAELGHRAIAYAGLNDPKVADLVELRLHRAQAAADAMGLRLVRGRSIGLTDGTPLVALKEWQSEGVTAVAAYNDDVAAAITGAALRAGIPVPDDLSVIGIDNTPLASMFQPQLSTIDVDTAGLGRYLARRALSAIQSIPPPEAGPEMRATLIRRASTAPPRKC